MSVIERTVHVNRHGYKEVVPAYRIARAAPLDAAQVSTKTGRIVCPMVDAARSASAYGQQGLAGTDSDNIAEWAKMLDVSVLGTKAIAYLSGPLSSALGNMIKGSFDDQAINGGFVHRRKNGVNTGIFSNGRFSQDGLNAFVWSFQPELEGISMTNEWLYSDQADALYCAESSLPTVLAYNRQNASAGKIGRGLKMSKFEMEKLLLGTLGQAVALDTANAAQQTQAILVRDIHDLYKYGLLPAHIEDKMQAAGMLNL